MASFEGLTALLATLQAHFGDLPVHAVMLDPPDDDPEALPMRQRQECEEALLTLAGAPRGGFLLVGVLPNRRVVGLANAPAAREALTDVADSCGTTLIDVEAVAVADEAVLVVQVHPQSSEPAERGVPRRPARRSHGRQAPSGGDHEGADRAPLDPWTLYTPDAATRARLLRDLPRQADTGRWDPEEWALIRIGALADSGGLVVPTLAGALVMGGDPTTDVPGSAITIEEGEDGRETVHRGPTRELIRRVAGLLTDSHPPTATSELLVNAVLHRDWSAAVRHVPIRVVRRSDGIDVVSPGGLANGGRQTRNATLVDLARRAGWCMAEHRGLERIRGLGTVDLDVRTVGASTWASSTTRRTRTHPPMSVRRPVALAGHSAPRSTPGPDAHRLGAPLTDVVAGNSAAAPPTDPPSTLARGLSGKEAEAYAAIAGGRGVTRQAIEGALGCSRSTARNVIEALVERGLVVRSVANARSPFQTYAVAVEGGDGWPIDAG